ncbi:uroporphyrinogen-III C-methyltransferase, partial [Burkholderia territorii]
GLARGVAAAGLGSPAVMLVGEAIGEADVQCTDAAGDAMRFRAA